MIDLGNGKSLTLALTVICRDEVECLEHMFRSLEPIRPLLDNLYVGITGDNPETRRIVSEYATKVIDVAWNNHHGEVRQVVHDLVTEDLILWLDADDVLLNANELEGLLKHVFADPQMGAVWLDYLYGHDSFGNVDSMMKRERIVRTSWFHWVGSLHENLLVKDLFSKTAFDERAVAVTVKHNSTPERFATSQRRCLEIATHQIKKEREAGAIDARTVLDLARALMTNGLYDESLKSFEEYIMLCGWDDMRYYALNLMADIYRGKEDYERSKNCNHLAAIMKPLWPEAYVGLAKTAYLEREWNQVIFWCETVSRTDSPAGVIPCNPTMNTIWPLRILHYAYANKGHFDKAIIVCEKALGCYPNDQELLNCLGQWQQAQRHIYLQASLEDVQHYLEEHGEPDKLQHLVQAIPTSMSDLPAFVRLKNQLFPPTPVSGKGRIVIFCGSSFEEWDPRSVGTGIGGSEEAVIYLAPLLAARGWVVDVYCRMHSQDIEKDFLGVRWKQWHTYDKDHDPGDIFIAWRLPDYLDFAPDNPTTKVYLWCHDVLKAEHWNESRIKKVDKVFVLSQYHATFAPNALPKDKLFFTRNGIQLAEFEGDSPRDPLKCIYMSSPDRGLEHLLTAWPNIKRAVPEATVDIFYGFTKNYDELTKGNYTRIKWKQQMLESCNQPGINYLGRRSHQEIARACKTGQLFIYPCIFSEISCISAMKAQAGGLIPVVFNYAALEETVQHGVKIPWDDPHVLEKWTQQVIHLLRHPEECEKIRGPMREWALASFGWDGVAERWDALFEDAVKTPVLEVAA